MNKNVKLIFRKQAQILKALAHESRLAIINRLYQGKCNVGDLVEMIGDDQSTVSKHLSILKAAGIIDYIKNGKKSEYYLVIPCVIEFLSCATRIINEKIKED